jgi:hypothetical protein
MFPLKKWSNHQRSKPQAMVAAKITAGQNPPEGRFQLEVYDTTFF